jgi:hypothetical protein
MVVEKSRTPGSSLVDGRLVHDLTMNCHFDRNIEYLDPQLTKANWWLHIFYEHVYFFVGRLRVKDPAKIGKLCWQISHCTDYSSCIEHSAIESPDTLVTFSRTGRQKTATGSASWIWSYRLLYIKFVVSFLRITIQSPKKYMWGMDVWFQTFVLFVPPLPGMMSSVFFGGWVVETN